MHSNQLAALPDEIGGLGSLQTLMVFNNRLVELPATMHQLAALMTL